MKLASKSSLLALLASLSFVMLVILLLIGERAGESFAFLAVAFPVLLIALGASRGEEGKLGRVGKILIALFLWLSLAAGALLFLREGVQTGAWPLGLPLGIWVQLVGFWFLPLILVGVGYALTFDSHGLQEEDLRCLRERWGQLSDPRPDAQLGERQS